MRQITFGEYIFYDFHDDGHFDDVDVRRKQAMSIHCGSDVYPSASCVNDDGRSDAGVSGYTFLRDLNRQYLHFARKDPIRLHFAAGKYNLSLAEEAADQGNLPALQEALGDVSSSMNILQQDQIERMVTGVKNCININRFKELSYRVAQPGWLESAWDFIQDASGFSESEAASDSKNVDYLKSISPCLHWPHITNVTESDHKYKTLVEELLIRGAENCLDQMMDIAFDAAAQGHTKTLLSAWTYVQQARTILNLDKDIETFEYLENMAMANAIPERIEAAKQLASEGRAGALELLNDAQRFAAATGEKLDAEEIAEIVDEYRKQALNP